MDCTITNLEKLTVPESIRKDLGSFLAQVIALYGQDLVSVTAFGSCVTGSYREKTSDINLLVVYSELNIADLDAVAGLAHKWLKKRRFAPRFLSRRNLVDSARYLQVDVLHMKNAHLVLCGEDIVASLPESLPDMKWQISHEIKKMRMRLKQQFWRAGGDRGLMRAILAQRASSVLHLTQALLYLSRGEYVPSGDALLEAAARELGVDAAKLGRLASLKHGGKPARGEINALFTDIMEVIRAADTKAENIR